MSNSIEHYILATGERDSHRLKLLHQVYGPGTEAAMHRVGLGAGMRVLEVGCGSGNITCWVAEQVGPTGSVLGIDNSAAQVEQARSQATARGLTNIEFQVADAYKPSLPEASFDIAYCRLVLMHLTKPIDALRAMRSLVKPGGTVLCGEMDLACWLCDPQAEAMEQFFTLNEALGERRNENFRLGLSLHRLFREIGFERPEVRANFPLALRGEMKRLLAMTFDQFAPELVNEKLATQEQVERVSKGLYELADDPTTLFGFPLIVQTWARR